MYKISDEQIDFILDDITKRGIVTEDVKYNILDHVCCIIESEMSNEKDFKKFYENTIARFYRSELSEIEEETRELITFKYYYAMKRTLKITGLISVLMIIAGSILKAMHLPGAGIFLVFGFAIFSLIFIPLNIVMKLRDDKNKTNKLVMSLGLFLTLTGTLGLLFKVMHWPWANFLFMGSVALFGLVFIPAYFFTRFRNPELKFNTTINTVFMIAAAGMLFGLINLKPSINIEESVESMDIYQSENIQRIKDSNLSIYNDIKDEEAVKEIKEASNLLNEKIEDIKANLIAKSNNISLEQAKGMTTEDLKSPNDYHVIRKYFESSKDETSLNALEKAISTYNSALENLEYVDVIRPIELEKLQMKNTILSVVLHELLDIQVQVLSNENSYLCLQKGLLATK
jgi:hypothetical protein